jgi:hypothetical protein
MNSTTLVRFTLGLALLLTAAWAPAARAQSGAVWHIPNNTSDLGGTSMRSPYSPINGLTGTITIYQGVWKGDDSNQTGGTLYYRQPSDGSWQSVALSWHADIGSNQYWKADIPYGSYSAGTVIQYYVRTNLSNVTGAPHFIYGTDSTSNWTSTESTAQAAPFSIAPDPFLTINGLNGDYTTSKFFIDERNDALFPDVAVVFAPGNQNAIEAGSVQVFTNLNRRDRAELDANSDGMEDGIFPPDGNLIPGGNDTNYYRPYAMSQIGGSGAYTITLSATKTGAYRLTARWRNTGDAANTWRWYSGPGTPRRDHAVVVSPRDARDLVVYEMNVFNVEASGTTFATRSTLEDLHNAPGAPHNGANHWDLDYLKNLGANTLWFQPIHPNGIEGRETDPGTGSAYDPGSPYAVKISSPSTN